VARSESALQTFSLREIALTAALVKPATTLAAVGSGGRIVGVQLLCWSAAASQGWLIIQDDTLTLTTAGLAAG
jgi:hypothetical protein